MRKHILQLGHGSNLVKDEAIQIVVVVLVLGKWEHQGHQAASGTAASPCSTFVDKHHPTDAWQWVFKPKEPNPLPQESAWAHYDQPDARQRHRRVFVPTVQLLCEHLPEPQI
ncbi:MAG: hypothetical protein NT154_01145 [Verrucomicrobia bacterium]|nr:hypothetical protein [Verrucomicrobiota bacterium]